MRNVPYARFPHGRWVCAALLACLWSLGAVPAWAEEHGTGDPAEAGLLVLKSQRVVQGRILRNGDDYLVKHANGDMFVPASLVQFRCRNLQDAYRQMRNAFPAHHGAESHMQLARWCVVQSLYAEARQELRDALLLEPDRAEASDMLARLNLMVDPAPSKTADRAPQESASRASARNYDEVESLGGLPREVAARFVRRIQPLLVNHCALAGCHGPQEDRDFKLQRVSLGGYSHRHLVERNLASVLKFIDCENPRLSPLLVRPRGNHGRRGQTIFIGQHGADQYREIKDWVLTVAANSEETQTLAAKKRGNTRGTSPVVPVAHAAPADNDRPSSRSGPADSPPSEKSAVAEKSTASPREQEQTLAPRETVPASRSAPPTLPRRTLLPPQGAERDPFDPEEFNRRATDPR